MLNLKSVLNTFKPLDPRILSLEEPILATEVTAARSFTGNGLTFYLKFLGTFKREESSSQAQDEATRKEICARLLCALKESKKKNKPQVALSISFSGLRVIDYTEGEHSIAAAVAWSDLVCMEIDEECDRTLGMMSKTPGTGGLTVLGLKTYFESTFKAKTIKDQITLLLKHMAWERERALLVEQKRLRQREKAQHDKKVKEDNQINEQIEKKMLKRKEEEETNPKAAVKSQKKEKRSESQAQPPPQSQPEPQPQPAVANLINLEEEDQTMTAAPKSRNLDALFLELMEDVSRPPKPKPVKRAGAKGAAKKSRKPLPPLPSPIEVVPPPQAPQSQTANLPQPETAQALQPENAPALPHHGGARPKMLAVKRDSVQPALPPRQRSRARRRLSLESEYELIKHFGGDHQLDPIALSSDRSNPDTPSSIYYEIFHPENEGRLVDVVPHFRRAPRHSSPKPRNTQAAKLLIDPFGTIENIQTACPPLLTVSTFERKKACTDLEDQEIPPPIPPKKFLSSAGAAGAAPRPTAADSALLVDLSFPVAAAAPPRGAVRTPLVDVFNSDAAADLCPIPAALPLPGATLPTAAVAAPSVQAGTGSGRRPPPPEPPVNPFDALMRGGVQILMKELGSKPRTTTQAPPPRPATTAMPAPRAN